MRLCGSLERTVKEAEAHLNTAHPKLTKKPVSQGTHWPYLYIQTISISMTDLECMA
jgi:hypothetical protein